VNHACLERSNPTKHEAGPRQGAVAATCIGEVVSRPLVSTPPGESDGLPTPTKRSTELRILSIRPQTSDGRDPLSTVHKGPVQVPGAKATEGVDG